MRANEFIVEEKVRLDPKCWTGKKIGNPKTKMKGGVRVNNCVPAESVTEMDKSQTPPGRDGSNDEGSKKEYPAKIITPKKAVKDGEKILNKAFKDSQRVDPRTGKKMNTKGVAEELAEEFDLIESIIEGIAAQNGVDAEAVWEDLESLTEDELYAFAVTSQLNEDWQKANKRDKTDGMSQKAVNAYRRENPGSKLKTAVTTKPSKLKKGGKASKRRKSYCSRSRGQMKMHSISCAKTPDKAICKARRRWNC